MTDSIRKVGAPPIVDGEFAFSWADFHKVAALVHAASGIVLHEGKATLVYARLAKRLRAIGLTSFRDYCAQVASEEGADERRAMVAAMTTNVTRFFREPHHFDWLRNEALPRLAAKARSGGSVRIWSAACSSGEEPYSIALSLLEHMPEAPRHDILILASDLDSEMIARAERGIYTASQVETIPLPMRRKWLQAREVDGTTCYVMCDAARSLVRFRELNLLDPWPMRRRFDLVFCRNVVIYFDEETQSRIWLRFADLLEPDGALCIGHSERIPRHLPFRLIGQTLYRRAS